MTARNELGLVRFRAHYNTVRMERQGMKNKVCETVVGVLALLGGLWLFCTLMSCILRLVGVA